MKRLLPLLAVPVFLVAGCSSGSDTAASAPATTAPAATSGLGGAAPTTTSATSAPSSSSGPSSSDDNGAGSGGGTSRCHTGDLSLSLTGGGGAAGTYHHNLVFTNKSSHSCTLLGYPGVSWVTGDNGTQLNDPFQREPGTKKTVTLAPKGQAHAVLVTHQALNYPTAKCKPVKTKGYRVYPPDETASIFVSNPDTECSTKGVNLGQVQVLESGPGTAGE